MIALPPRAPRKVTETDVVHACIAACNRLRGVRCTRNNVGSLPDPRGIPVTFGLGEGSPDIMGGITLGGVNGARVELVELEPIALVFCIEVKKPRALGGRGLERNQRAWAATARRRGFLVGEARAPEEAVAFVEASIEAHVRRLVRIAELLR